MDRSDASALADLQMHWDEAYVIGLDGDIWSARYHTSTDELRAHTSSELRELIRSDYTYRQRVDPASRDSVRDAHEQDEVGDEDGMADDAAGAGETETSTEGQAGEPSVGPGDDAASVARRTAADVNFAAIRGERMST
jgi:hypothetical protein